MATEAKNVKYYFSLDIETRGVLYNNPVTAIGVYAERLHVCLLHD
jgi:hypothetical protein